jgi:CheY-like chemotaxis protein
MNESAKTILFIEDEDPIRTVLSKRMRKEGYKVLEATDGKEGIKQLEKNKVDLLLLDILMPVMDGYEFLSLWKGNEKFSKVPVLVVSNLNDKDSIEKARAFNIVDYVTKANLDLEEVVDKVNEIVRQ